MEVCVSDFVVCMEGKILGFFCLGVGVGIKGGWEERCLKIGYECGNI